MLLPTNTSSPVSPSSCSAHARYFNTFGGNALCCAAGLAVLDVIERDDLCRKASDVGRYLMDALQTLKEREDGAGRLIGDIRGSGLFVGVEFVQDRDSRDLVPAAAQTSILVTRLKDEHQILTSIDGPDDNVLVMKPPMCFNRDNVDLLISKMALVLQGITEEDVRAYTHTPT